jgi:hypothetical protein
MRAGGQQSLNRGVIAHHQKDITGVRAMKILVKFEEEVSTWAGVSIHRHRFGGREFLFGPAEVGHVHPNGILDIPLPRPLHAALLAEGLAEEHRWVPQSGWITFRIRGEQDFKHALWLMRLSYLRYALKRASDPRILFEQEAEQLRLSSLFKSLLESFVPKTVKDASSEQLPA